MCLLCRGGQSLGEQHQVAVIWEDAQAFVPELEEGPAITLSSPGEEDFAISVRLRHWDP